MVRFLLVLALSPAAVAVTAAPASAVDEVAVTIGAEGTLLDPTLVRIAADITCQPTDSVNNMGSFADLHQAVSKSLIARGRGNLESPPVCDGVPHSNAYLIWADTVGPPFEKGDATVIARLSVCNQMFQCRSADTGIRVIRLRN